MKEAITKNWMLKVVALGVSFLLWLIVVNVQDPPTIKRFTGIPVVVEHAEIITNRGNTYQLYEDSKQVTVEVKAKISDMEKIKKENIRVIADMKNLETKSNSLIPLSVKIDGYTGAYPYTATAIPGNAQIRIEANKTKTFPITVEPSGTLRSGYVIGEAKADPEKIEISGPESIISIIKKVVADVDVTGISKDVVKEANLKLYDGNGAEISLLEVEHNLGEEGLKVELSLHHKKSVDVLFDTSKISVADGYVMEGVTLEPDKIEVIGEPETLDKVNNIKVPAEALVENELSETVERTINIAEYLPEGLQVVDETIGAPILVKIAVAKSGTRVLEFPVGSISVSNIPPGYKLEYGVNGSIKITVTGSADVLKEMEELESGSVTLNLAGYSEEGVYTMPLQVVLPDGIELAEPVEIEVKLSKK